MAGTGGARPGAGRPRKADKFKRPIAAAEKQIADRLPHIVDKLLELADGVLVSVEDRDGNERIYQQPPSFKALEYLGNRIMGKPTERTELSGPGGGPMEFDDLDDTERAARAASLLDRARARRARQAAAGSEPV